MDESMAASGDGIPKFKCPRHFCETCFEEYKHDARFHQPLYTCVKCPRAFHFNCIPLSCRTSSIALMCSKHPYDKVPDKDIITPGEIAGVAPLLFSQVIPHHAPIYLHLSLTYPCINTFRTNIMMEICFFPYKMPVPEERSKEGVLFGTSFLLPLEIKEVCQLDSHDIIIKLSALWEQTPF
jgi:hypothetical protein